MEQWLIDANALKAKKTYSHERHEYVVPVAEIDWMPTVDAVPWEFLERYADWFCASVSFPEFIREAKAFYRSTVAAMDGFTISDGERRTDETDR